MIGDLWRGNQSSSKFKPALSTPCDNISMGDQLATVLTIAYQYQGLTDTEIGTGNRLAISRLARFGGMAHPESLCSLARCKFIYCRCV